MLEFAYLLHRRRDAERKNCCKKLKQLRKEDTLEETLEEEALKSTTKENNQEQCNMFERRQQQVVELNSKKMEQQKFWTKSHIINFKCCTLNIDVFSQWLFLSMFTLFNLLYWSHYLKFVHLAGIIY
jgi:hypothetical protein